MNTSTTNHVVEHAISSVRVHFGVIYGTKSYTPRVLAESFDELAHYLRSLNELAQFGNLQAINFLNTLETERAAAKLV